MVDFTKHVLERYVERTKGYTDANEIKQYLVLNEDTVKERILKLFESAELMYTGKLREFTAAEIYINKNGWVFPLDKKNNKLITVYKVDLKVGEEFNREYTSRMMEAILAIKTEYESMQFDIMMKSEEIKEENEAIKAKIAIHKNILRTLEEELKNNNERVIINNKKLGDKENELQMKLEDFICKKIF